MTPDTIRALVDRGLALREIIESAQNELEDIETQLEAAALAGQQVPLEDPEREGRQFLATGTRHTVPIVLTADAIAQSFQERSVMHENLRAIAGDLLVAFYRPVTTHKIIPKSGKQFRRAAAEILGDKAPQFISAALTRDKHGIPKSSIKIEWARAAGIPA